MMVDREQVWEWIWNQEKSHVTLGTSETATFMGHYQKSYFIF